MPSSDTLLIDCHGATGSCRAIVPGWFRFGDESADGLPKVACLKKSLKSLTESTIATVTQTILKLPMN
jgi:hypothetical protein